MNAVHRTRSQLRHTMLALCIRAAIMSWWS